MWLFGALSSPEEVQIHSVQSTHPRNYVYSVHFCPQTGVLCSIYEPYHLYFDLTYLMGKPKAEVFQKRIVRSESCNSLTFK